MSVPTRYSAVGQSIHWLTAVVVLVAFIFGPGGSEARVYLPARDFQRELHETLGFTVFMLVLLRLAWRAGAARPASPDVPYWMELAATAVQGGLYILMLALPLTAISGAWLEGHSVTLLAGIHIPPAFGEFHDTGKVVAEIHTWLGDAIMWLAGLHAAAALFHHFVMKDEVLLTMLPAWLGKQLSRLR